MTGRYNALAVVDSGPPPTHARRDLLLQALHEVQDRDGWISPEALADIGARLGIAPAEVYSVASFYGAFSLAPRPRRIARVCDDVVCLARGAPPPAEGELASPCLGRCERAPARMTTEGGVEVGEGPPVATAVRQADRSAQVLLARIGVIDPTSLAAYTAAGGYAALRSAVAKGREAVIAAISRSGLVGRGGAAFPAGRKWEAVARAPGPRVVVCNADESEPGTFKDRVLLEGDPFAIVEAMTIAGFAVGADVGYVYIRDEYPRARQSVETAVAAATQARWLGDDVGGLGFPFRIEVRRGAGAYVCGEETALFNSIEGRRGEPRNKPPFPSDAGLFGRPTLVHNVETLAAVRAIAAGADRVDTKLFAVSGCVAAPGVYEVPLGTPLRALIDQAGGVAGGATLQAVLLGGAAGAFVTPDELDVALTFTDVRTVGASLGSGAVIVLDDTVDLGAVLARIATFFREESCGQCVPCRVGTVRQEEALHRLLTGRVLGSVTDECTRLSDLGAVMRDASICGLGQTASSAIESALAKGLGPFAPAPPREDGR